MSYDLETLKAHTAHTYHLAPDHIRVVLSPYRICPLGAHIDHQLGRVTAMALDQGVMLAYAASPAGEMRLRSLDFPGQVAFHINQVGDKIDGDWGNYPRGAVTALQQRHRLRHGLYGITAGKLGAGGLSSSAAIGVAYLLALQDVNDLRLSPAENIALDQSIENDYLGLNNGILDQAAVLLSQQNHLTVINCATAEHQLIATPPAAPFNILIAFSGLQQALTTTDYNLRVAECNQAATTLLTAAGKPATNKRLGHVTLNEYAAYKHLLTGPLAKRATHFFDETQRVTQGIAAWTVGDLDIFGHLMTESGHSSIHNYQCGSPPLIDLYDIMVNTEGVYGARFSGAGFRGCCVALVHPDAATAAKEAVQSRYAQRHPNLAANAPVIHCGTGDGVRVV